MITRLVARLVDCYEALGLQPQDFQTAVRQAWLNGQSGLLSVPTGSGKTLAAVAGPLEAMAAQPLPERTRHRLRLLLITPLRALSRDSRSAVDAAVAAMGIEARVESRTGDVSSYRKRKQSERMPDILVTTPESLSVLLAQKGAAERFRYLDTVVLDEWHECWGDRRGCLCELALSQVRQWRPGLRTWALSATLSDPQAAATAACGQAAAPIIIASDERRPVDLHLIPPPADQHLPWAGHLGLRMAPTLLSRLDPDVATLLFTNTRRQAEIWYRHLCEQMPDLASAIALHHGSIAQAHRSAIEEAAKAGKVRWTVATASMDLGIDYGPIDRVVQIGSPKSVARLIQRAGRAAHRPGGRPELWFVPTHAMELVEFRALESALGDGVVEARPLRARPLDVLAQHLVTLACGDGFDADDTFAALGDTAAYADLDRKTFDWVLDFVAVGGQSLGRYDHYRKLAQADDGRWQVRTPRIARDHRVQIGTIDSDAAIPVVLGNRRRLGEVEERFIGQLRPGDTFHFAGKLLRFVGCSRGEARVATATGRAAMTPAWAGGTMAVSPTLAAHLRTVIATADDAGPAAAVLDAQAATSHRPSENELLAEILDRDGTRHIFIHTFAGKHEHEGIAALIALRIQRLYPSSISVRVNDYGMLLESSLDLPVDSVLGPHLLSDEGLDEDLEAAVNIDALSRRAFRGIARVCGLVGGGVAAQRPSHRQLQTSSDLLFDVFSKHEPDNLLIAEARREVRETRLDTPQLRTTLHRLRGCRWRVVALHRPSPFAFPLMIEQLNQQTSTLDPEERAARLRAAYGIG